MIAVNPQTGRMMPAPARRVGRSEQEEVFRQAAYREFAQRYELDGYERVNCGILEEMFRNASDRAALSLEPIVSGNEDRLPLLTHADLARAGVGGNELIRIQKTSFVYRSLIKNLQALKMESLDEWALKANKSCPVDFFEAAHELEQQAERYQGVFVQEFARNSSIEECNRVAAAMSIRAIGQQYLTEKQTKQYLGAVAGVGRAAAPGQKRGRSRHALAACVG